MPEVRIIAKNFMDMVASMPAMKLDKLYENGFICEAILRSLPPLARKYILQMLYIDAQVTAKSMEEWVLPDGTSKHRVAIDRLVQLRVFIETVDRKSEKSYKLNPTFQRSLQILLINGGTLPREPMPSNITVRLPSLEDLEAYALEQWECFLLQLISQNQAERPSNIGSSLMKVFQRHLMKQRDKEGPRLTASGFQFLLMDTNAQLWYVIREYISNSEARGVDAAELISFLLELSFHVIGEAYNINTLTDFQRNTIKDLADIGLVKLQQGRKESWFIPTKLATNLSVSLADSSSRKQGFMVVETNFRVYAYTTSKLHCEILRLFSSVEYQLPNLIVGAITKESLYNAFENGITAEQIISFLQQNAHPRVAERIPAVPENVTDQMRLWESDLNRVEMTEAYYYDEFPSRDVFEGACDCAREWNGLLWEDSKKMHMVVKTEVHPYVRDYLRRQK
ncbi:general transcription and DNA repair factor IIH subunit TFB2 [Prosopis cineraria]|uniref:general transcription and DNA repair factor IIH subunit TFB2 n=1 Tax=Prosopis cineraria TaxID=364024 RepID=UPI00240FC75C|nr:general transcription and DNA repair factor IIH subunit TFB2 [Prosopis cineraria]XP_054803642.1 general transcription and DNA repair factor IIH subunit TFB2 [Prosopis cineraria]